MVDFRQAGNVITDESLSKVANLAELQLKLEANIEELEKALTERKEALRKVQEYDLPEAMAECGVSEIKTKDGFKVTVKPFYSGKITDTEACHNWLRANDFEGIIKHNLQVELGKGQDDLAPAVKEFIKTLGLSYVDKEGVHHSTLNAFIKEQIEGGNTDFPQALFNVFVGRKAKISVK